MQKYSHIVLQNYQPIWWLSVSVPFSVGAHAITKNHRKLFRHCIINLGGNMTQFSEGFVKQIQQQS